jgi:hypothetical protein
MLLAYLCKDAHSCSRWPTRPGYSMLERCVLQHLLPKVCSGQQPGSVCCACVCRLYWIHCLLSQQVCCAGLSRVPAQRGGQQAGSCILQTNKLQSAMATVVLASPCVCRICHTAIVRASLWCNPVSSSPESRLPSHLVSASH